MTGFTGTVEVLRSLETDKRVGGFGILPVDFVDPQLWGTFGVDANHLEHTDLGATELKKHM